MMAGAQLGITVCSLGLGYLGEPAVAHVIEGPLESLGVPAGLLHPIAFAIALSFVAFLHIVLGEMVPKNIALAGPDRAALALGPPLVLVVRILHPAIASLNWIANITLRLLGVVPRDEIASTFTRDEVAGLILESRREGMLDKHGGERLVGAIEFERRTAESVLLPIDELETVTETVTPAELETVAARTGFSRFPVRRGEQLIGYLHIKDVLEFEDVHRNRPIATAWVRPLPEVSLEDGLREALETMQAAEAHLARVLSADQRLFGVIALEDVLEELVGEIRDEAGAAAASSRVPRVRPA
jgi:CBS domain containing-hemolysin-like protein